MTQAHGRLIRFPSPGSIRVAVRKSADEVVAHDINGAMVDLSAGVLEALEFVAHGTYTGDLSGAGLVIHDIVLVGVEMLPCKVATPEQRRDILEMATHLIPNADAVRLAAVR